MIPIRRAALPLAVALTLDNGDFFDDEPSVALTAQSTGTFSTPVTSSIASSSSSPVSSIWTSAALAI